MAFIFYNFCFTSSILILFSVYVLIFLLIWLIYVLIAVLYNKNSFKLFYVTIFFLF